MIGVYFNGQPMNKSQSVQFNKLLELSKQAELIRRKITDLENQIVKEHAPWKVGDIIKVNGYAHHGKDMEITHIIGNIRRINKGEFHIEAHGSILKKDGTKTQTFKGTHTIILVEAFND